MNDVSIDNIICKLREKKIPEYKLEEVRKSYEIASEIHSGQFRESGEPYIIHPLNVATNVLKMEIFDPDTISAALLHDTIEDAKIDFTKEDVAKLINPEVAELVDGVTKIRRMQFDNKNAQNLANTRKIINGLTKDIRIIFIKLADRLHNMQTLDYKKPEKQISNANETMHLFVPLALTLGAYRIKNELEELSLKYIDPNSYKMIKEKRDEIEERETPYLHQMADNIKRALNNEEINNEIVYRNQSLNTIYKKLQKGYEMESMYDLCYFKILVKEIEDCYRTLYVVHRYNRPINGRLKDYICNPRTNFYQSIHTTVTDHNGSFRKVKIRTYKMDKIAGFGIPAYWNFGETYQTTQEYIGKRFQFAKKLMELNENTPDDQEFVNEIYSELLSENVYVYTKNGLTIELPAMSTAMDFACQVYGPEIAKMTGIIINGKTATLNQQLKNNDRIEIVTDGQSIDNKKWESYAHTQTAKQKIKQLRKQGIINRQK